MCFCNQFVWTNLLKHLPLIYIHGNSYAYTFLVFSVVCVTYLIETVNSKHRSGIIRAFTEVMITQLDTGQHGLQRPHNFF